VKKSSRRSLIPLVTFALVFAILFGSHTFTIAPEWQLLVIDEQNRPATDAPVHEEWVDPDMNDYAQTNLRPTNSPGLVVFPGRRLQINLAQRLFTIISLRTLTPGTAHVSLCSNGQFAQVDWNKAHRRPSRTLQLHSGGVPMDPPND
jgi:hypothetical protein